MKSISKYPLPIICEQQCLMLEGVGSKMSKVLKSLIEDHYRAYRTNPPPKLSSQFIEDTVAVCDDEEDINSVRSCNAFQHKPSQA
jgi:hypothetical protein